VGKSHHPHSGHQTQVPHHSEARAGLGSPEPECSLGKPSAPEPPQSERLHRYRRGFQKSPCGTFGEMSLCAPRGPSLGRLPRYRPGTPRISASLPCWGVAPDPGGPSLSPAPRLHLGFPVNPGLLLWRGLTRHRAIPARVTETNVHRVLPVPLLPVLLVTLAGLLRRWWWWHGWENLMPDQTPSEGRQKNLFGSAASSRLKT
jgi:hypothetical protein